MITTEAVTADVSEQSLVYTGAHSNAYIYVSGTTLGGGALSILVRQAGTGPTFRTIDTALALGNQFKYEIGNDMEVAYTLSGATSPDFEIIMTTGN